MRNYFGNKELMHAGHTYVVDYTEPDVAGSTPDGRKVEISATPPDRKCFRLVNEGAVYHLAANLEHYPADFCQKNNCEAFLVPLDAQSSGDERPWLLFLELKYCHASNPRKEQNDRRKIDENLTKALQQMLATRDRVKEMFGLDHTTHSLYVNIHFPWLEEYSPFACSYWHPDFLTDLRADEHVNLLGCPALKALSPYHLSEP